SDISIYEDNRLKALKIYHPSYPYTIKFSYTKDYNGILSYPSWYPQTNFNISVQQSDYEISYPKEMQVRFKTHNTKNPHILVNEKTNIASFTTKNLKAYFYEPMSNGVMDV